MKLTFLGAAETVTGSKYLLEGAGLRILIDCGLFQGTKNLRLRNWNPLPTPVDTLDAVILTHAHLDHTGYLPVLARSGYRGPVYCTPGTADLCDIMLRDSAHLKEEEADFANRHGFSKHKPALPLYTLDDAQHALRLMVPREFDVPTPLNEHRLTASQTAVMDQAAIMVRTVEQSKAIAAHHGPMVIIAGSGMATGGRVLHHLSLYAPDHRNTIALVGYQAAGTRGAAIAAHEPTIKIHGEYVPIRAQVESISSLSAHADYAETLEWLTAMSPAPTQTFITHGEPAAADALRRRISDTLGWPCTVPVYLQSVELAERAALDCRPAASAAAGAAVPSAKS